MENINIGMKKFKSVYYIIILTKLLKGEQKMKRQINVVFIFTLLILTFFSLVESTNAGIIDRADAESMYINEVDNICINLIEVKYVYRLFHVGRIENVYDGENYVSFDSINLWRISRLRATDSSFWDFSISHYEGVHHSLEDYRFIGILTDNFIYGTFFKSV